MNHSLSLASTATGTQLRRAALLAAFMGLGPAAFGQTPTFGALGTYATGTGTNPQRVAVADMNGDGKRDALVTNAGTNTVALLLGNGSGGFTLQSPAAPIGAGTSPRAVAVADVNLDGRPDAVVANYTTGTLAVLLGNGSGGLALQTPAPSTGGTNPTSLVMADVNGDGKPDALTTNSNGGNLGVLLGNGSGGFTYQSSSPATGGSIPYAVAVADVNADGKLDALVGNYDNGTLGVLLGNGAGGFTLQATTPATGATGSVPYSVAVADVNGDGKPDALVANYGTSTLGVLLGNGSGGFTLQASSPSTGAGSRPSSVVVADVNGDGKRDAVVANSSSGRLGILLGDGSGNFTLQTTTLPAGASSSSFSLAVADVNGDFKPDALTVSFSDNSLSVQLNTTTGGNFLVARTALPGASATLSPNPAHAGTTLTATGLPAATTQLAATLLDPIGQQVRRLAVPAMAGAATVTVPTTGLATGLYLLRLDASDAQGAALGTLPTQRLSVE